LLWLLFGALDSKTIQVLLFKHDQIVVGLEDARAEFESTLCIFSLSLLCLCVANILFLAPNGVILRFELVLKTT